jgi:hypothetical protein
MRLVALTFALIGGLALQACTAVWSDEPLSQPLAAHYDPRVLGNWFDANDVAGAGAYWYLRVAPGADDTIRIFFLSHWERYGQTMVSWCASTAYPTIVEREAIYNVKPISCSEVALEPRAHRPRSQILGYVIVLVAVRNDNRLSLRFLDPSKLQKLQRSGNVQLREVTRNFYDHNLIVETPGREVVTLIQRLGSKALFADRAYIFTRLKTGSTNTLQQN